MRGLACALAFVATDAWLTAVAASGLCQDNEPCLQATRCNGLVSTGRSLDALSRLFGVVDSEEADNQAIDQALKQSFYPAIINAVSNTQCQTIRRRI